NPEVSYSVNHYILPEYAVLSSDKRVNLLFVQLLDFSRFGNFTHSYRSDYALSLLILEISRESLISQNLSNNNIPTNIIHIIEWIRANYNQVLTVQGIAKKFHYNPTYLSSLFKKHTNYPLLDYINRTRISVAKNLLTDPTNTLFYIAQTCGFNDDKYFMKIFKKFEGMTPSQYRNAFNKKKINKS
ncbi:MAG TPA: helix-turn-helix transcriptional regulator, partial [Epulopiscium sp.]|nr:helix-turn-helix transcriptional regulator [Candidatus Epulonipiscium sp.]